MMRGKLLSVLLCIMLLALTISPGVASADSSPISPTVLPDATVGVSYDASVSVVGGTGQYTYTITGLPDALNGSADGSITGIPASAGDSVIQVVYDNGAGDNNDSSPASIPLHINAANGGSGGGSTVSVTGVTLGKTTDTIVVPDTDQLTATVEPSGATNQTVSWASDTPGVATVSSSGLVTAVAPGNANITVTTADGSFTATCATTVQAATVSAIGVSLDKTTDSLAVGDTDQITAVVTPNDATDQNVTWSSSDDTIATVDWTGAITAVAVGSVNITATTEDGGYTATCDVQVYTVSATGVSLNLTRDTITARSDTALVATALIASMQPANASNQNVAWSSDTPSVATVNQSGEVSAVAPGYANVTVTTEDGGYAATCAITVIPSSQVIPISTALGMENISNNLTGNYQQTTNIDLTGYSWTPIGDIPYEDAQGNTAYQYESFSGNFNGGGKKITGSNLFGEAFGTIENINAGSLSSGDGFTGYSIGGLVGEVPSGASLTITNCSYTGPLAGSNSTLTESGGLVGRSDGDISISNCSYTGPLAGINSTLTRTGGLVGMSDGVSTLTNDSFSGTFCGEDSTLTDAGGLVGMSDGVSTLTNDSFSGTLCGKYSTLTDVGGLVGDASNTLAITHSSSVGVINADGESTLCFVGGMIGSASSGTTISNSFFNGSIFSGEFNVLVCIGGLVGVSDGATITNCYSADDVPYDRDGGLVGINGTGTVTSSYYDEDIAGPGNDVGTPEPTDLMMQQATFVNWDYSNIWAINEGVSYPYFGTSLAADVAVTGVTLNKSTDALKPGDSDQLVATVQPDDATDQSVTWTSDTPGVATVDQTGLVQAVASGTANITVTTEDGGFTAVCQVIVSASGSSAALSTTQYAVAYDGNGATGGTVPVDGNGYDSGANVIVLDNTGGLSRTGYAFAGWNTAADESGTRYQQGDSFSIVSSDAILYAQWKQIVITISPDSLPGGTVGASYSQTLTASGGTAPYGFTEAGSLPDGLTLSGGGALTGTPAHAGVSSFTVTATDSSDSACSQAYTLTVDSAQTPTAPPAPIGGGGGGGVSSPPDPLAPQKPVQQASPTSGQPAAPAPPAMQQPGQPAQPDSQQPTVQKRPLASLPVGTQSSKQPTVQKSVTQIVSPAPVAAPPVSPVKPAPVAPAPARRYPVLPVVGSLALIAAIAVLLKKHPQVMLLALLPNRVVSVAISLQPAGAVMAMVFDDKKRKPSKVTVDVVNGSGKVIARDVVVSRGQSTPVTLPAMVLGEKMRFTAKTRGYRNISKNRSVEFTDR